MCSGFSFAYLLWGELRAAFSPACVSISPSRRIATSPAEKLGDVLRVISAYKIAKDAPAPQPKPKAQPKPEPAAKPAKPADTREQRRKRIVLGTITAFDIVYDRLVDLVCDDEKDWPPQKVTRALDDMSKNASILEAWLTLQSAR